MTKVSLRVYNREIEGMIEANQLEEAIAHCQHILKTFPMYIESYRLLGKTFLEARRYADAADIFQRALMAVPDDFVSHVGMSIIRDDEGKLDDAIWHMERAFEVQPSNSAIQGELRRLYGRRDGVEPPKIRLSRDALANMYSQGELFNQAIAEIRSVLADDPNRPDLQVMLARANYRAGQKVEAAEMAASLLKNYPYCLDALRVLADVLPGTTRGENTQIYRHRLGMLDPYSAFATDSVFASDQVPDAAVTVERLDYKPGAMPAASQPNWASSLGIQLGNEKRAESTPAWLNTEATTGQPAPSAAGSSTSEPAAADNSVPDWMRSAGWQESSGTQQESPMDSNQEPPAEPIAQADIPDWLKSMAPPEVTEAENVAPEPTAGPQPVGEADIPDWLKSMARPAAAGIGNASTEAASFETPTTNVEPSHAEEGSLPDWLKSTPPAAATGMENIITEPTPSETPPSNVEPSPAEEGALPDWLTSMAPTVAASTENVESALPPIEASPSNAEPGPAEEGALPDWLTSMAPAAAASTESVEGATASVEEPPSGTKPGLAEEGALPDWLTSMASTETTGTENVVNQPAPVEIQPANAEPVPGEEEAFPDWLKSMASEETTGSENVENMPASAETPAMNAGTEPAGEGSFPDWLKSIAPAAASSVDKIESVPTPLETPSTNIEPEPAEEGPFPNWLTSLSGGADTKATPEFEPYVPEATQPEEKPTPVQPAPVEALPPVEQPANELKGPPMPAVPESGKSNVPVNVSDSQPFQPTGEVKPLEIGDDALGWLESLAAKQGANPDELLTKPLERSEEMPDWLNPAENLKPTPVEQKPEEAPAESLPLEPIPSVDKNAAPTPIPSMEEVVPAVEESLPSEAKTEETAQPVTIEDDTMAWLEGLAAKQGANPEELLTKPENRPEETPEWIQNASTEQPVAPVETPVSVEPETPASVPVSSEEDVTIGTWLSSLDKPEAGINAPSIAPIQEDALIAQEDLPDWLKDLDKPAVSEPVDSEAAKVDTDLPDWLRQPTQPAVQEEAQQEEVKQEEVKQEEVQQPPALEPVSELTPEQEMPAWMEEPEEGTGFAAPTVPDEWIPVEKSVADVEIESALDETPAVAEPALPPVEAPIQAQVLKGTGILAQIPLNNKDAESLTAAQNALDNNSLVEAMKEYGKLIKKGHLLDEVIHDLREAIYRFPVDVIVWQTLGDAYMRANRLQDALDAYTKAEELLR